MSLYESFKFKSIKERKTVKAAIYQAKYYMDQSYCEQGIEEALNALDSCDESTIGINRKLLGAQITQFYCMDCLAERLDTTVQDLLDKIEEFKEEGCKLFS